ncbi:hypothetical protein OROHE_005582 [Orobanche hederae]
MGNWNHRYRPRRKFRHYDYEDPPLSPSRSCDNSQTYSSDNHVDPSGSDFLFWRKLCILCHHFCGVTFPYLDHFCQLKYWKRVGDNRVPSWEIDYCNSARVPWRKILASKKYIYCYPNVLDWDASAGEEALQNAKKRYWAMINGLPCDNPLPDPNIYVGEIDWNPDLDPELMADLDLQIFPDEEQNAEKMETINEGAESAHAQYGKTQSTNDNPWEKDHVQGTGSSKEAVQGWSRWDDSVNLKNESPWEQSSSQPVDSLKDNVWKSANESWGWCQGTDNGNSCNYVRQEGWGPRENHSWGWSRGNSNGEGLRNLGNSRNACGNDFLTGSEERVWRVNMNESWNRRESEYQGNDPKYWNSQSYQRGGRSFRGDGRKREGFQQHGSRYKSSRYHGDTYGDNRQW